ncbi:unnamed protein product [Blepharisma stoltei]|uniref:ornithine decarboxylase n=1 Tax=Blepharisma stoltei TaxID=1481888 RepID=A0AAU9JW61_9CILI|nr:unnamed protein product [Blepharisma stoltei]
MRRTVRDNLGWKIRLGNEASTKEIFSTILRQKEFENNIALYDLSKINSLVERWHQKLPLIRPFYAVKSNPDPEMMLRMASLGLGFDCASKNELEFAQNTNVNFETDVICAQPFKSQRDLRAISNLGVKYTTFDCVEELQKISNFGLKNLKMILRIQAGDEESASQYNQKFGALSSEYDNIFEFAIELGMNIVGISFYVGHSMKNTIAYYHAIKKASEAWKIAENYGFAMEILDVGGGFNEKYFDRAANDINRGISEFFREKNIKIIAEPGKYLSASVVSSCFTVVGKRSRVINGETHIDYILSDGVEGTLRFLPYADDNLPVPIYMGDPENPPKFHSTFFGPTCSGDDRIYDHDFPSVDIGDKICFDVMGSYSVSWGTNFNSIPMITHTKLYIDEDMDN